MGGFFQFRPVVIPALLMNTVIYFLFQHWVFGRFEPFDIETDGQWVDIGGVVALLPQMQDRVRFRDIPLAAHRVMQNNNPRLFVQVQITVDCLDNHVGIHLIAFLRGQRTNPGGR